MSSYHTGFWNGFDGGPLGDMGCRCCPEADDASEENPSPSTHLPRGPIQSEIANPFTPTASSSPSGTHTGAAMTNPTPTTPVSMSDRQPGGQGLAADFDAVPDETRSGLAALSLPHTQPFKKEMCIAQGVARKAKTKVWRRAIGQLTECAVWTADWVGVLFSTIIK
ncbi:hypothetical protein EDB84DRAFT_1439104 [Lactarius hengduanensis]|nr:hypothetical protein EDB84DRAFT_1439104 [Lactarius hengduanensis]